MTRKLRKPFEVNSKIYDRAVIGGGFFGTYSALHLANLGYKVALIEQDSELLLRASYVNQARLHTGLHYPRSLITAKEALNYYEFFRQKFPEAIHDFKQIYAIARHNSKTSSSDFFSFIERLGLPTQNIDPNRWFKEATVETAISVVEPSFDANSIRSKVRNDLLRQSNIELFFDERVSNGGVSNSLNQIVLTDGTIINASGIVVAAYASTNSVRASLGLSPLPIKFELTEVLLGLAIPEMRNVGLTIMDGPFWSVMPFGKSGLSSLTNVGLTPIYKNDVEPKFNCQTLRLGCGPENLDNCNHCNVRPAVGFEHHIQQLSLFLRDSNFFSPQSRITTVKAILRSSEVDDARPTLIHKESDSNVWTIFSGKMSTVFDIERALI